MTADKHSTPDMTSDDTLSPETAKSTTEQVMEPQATIDPLVDSGMRFGSLVRIDSQFHADRYNQILAEFGLPAVAKAPFHLDIAGFSVEVAAALGDFDYLDPNGSNRRFVILTNRQANAPLIHSTFSCEKAMLQHFFAANEIAIGKATLHSALYGEIENYAYRLETPGEVAGLQHVDIICHALGNYFKERLELRDLLERFRDINDLSVRHDETQIARIIALAKRVGDVRSADTEITDTRYRWPSAFSSRLFGGSTFISPRTGGGYTLICRPAKVVSGIDSIGIVDQEDPRAVSRFLMSSNLATRPSVDWLKNSGFLQHRLETLAAHLILSSDPSADGARLASPRGIGNAIRSHIDTLCADERFAFLNRLRGLTEHDPNAVGAALRDNPDHAMMLTRAEPDRDATPEVNRLLARMNAFDPVTLFSLDKEAFYRLWQKSPANIRAYMQAIVETVYMPTPSEPDRKTRLKARFFG